MREPLTQRGWQSGKVGAPIPLKFLARCIACLPKGGLISIGRKIVRSAKVPVRSLRVLGKPTGQGHSPNNRTEDS